MAQTANFYDILGVQRNASATAIREAYKMRVNSLHPWNEEDANERWARQQILQQVADAYSALRNRRQSRRRHAH